jgi:UrcA family protein
VGVLSGSEWLIVEGSGRHRKQVQEVIMKVVTRAALSFAVCSLAATANANPFWIDPAGNEHVSYADLDLTSAASDKRLEMRIEYAAQVVCLIDPGASPSPAVADPACFKRAANDGLTQMQRLLNHRHGEVTIEKGR